MTDGSQYTTLTRHINVEVFLNGIESYIRSLIRKYGHKNCGLKHEELCKEIKTFITKTKTLILSPQDEEGKNKWNREWSSKKNKFYNKLFQEEGFTYTCDSTKNTHNPSLYLLKSKHIEFCQERDVWKATVKKKNEFDECVKYNQWIETQKKSFHQEYLNNVREFTAPTVNKYFSSKEHPQGHYPVRTYLRSKLDCNRYNPPPRSDPKIAVAKAPTISLHSPAPPDLDQKSQGKGGRSIPGGAGETEKEKSDIKIRPEPEPPSSDSLASSQTKIKVDSTDNGQSADLKAKDTNLPSKDQDAKGKPDEEIDTKAQSPEQLSEPKSSISPKDSSAATVPDSPSVIKAQDKDSDATLSTTSATSDATHSTQNVQSSLTPNLSLVQSQLQPQPPDVDPGTDNNPKEPTSDPAIKSPAPDTSPTTALDPRLVSAPAAASNSIASETSSTTVFTATVSNSDSHTTKDPLLITVLPQSTTTTSIITTPIHTQTTTAVSAMGTKAIPSINEITSTTEGHGNPQVSIKNLPDSQDPAFASPKKQDDIIPSHLGVQSLDPQTPSYSGASANLNINLSTGQTLGTSPGPLGPLPDSPSYPPPGLSSPIPPGRSPEGSPDVSSPVRVVNKPGKHLNYNLFIQSHL
ncbi:hypothetical protein POVWA1_066860 [Plasmodium ovale wallikeri]|uniref:STP1 protein n=1 Tax=Plasmodium ovale wallikeri TaxID=864142 RepID=A0A1A9AF49_PLAOA|nr:hypothetical protein POVWA1_066860 [Plasmodium ovale wallikeri]